MPFLAAQFLVLALVVAVAGWLLARAADQIAEATGLGRLLIGSLLLAAVTSLPELSVDVAAVRAGFIDLAAGDLLGSSLMNLLILAVIDLSIRSGRRMLSREAASHALSATLGIALTALAGLAVLTAERLPAATLLGIGGWSWAILLAYLLGARMLFINQRIAVRLAAEARADTPAAAVEPVVSATPVWRSAAVFAVSSSELFGGLIAADNGLIAVAFGGLSMHFRDNRAELILSERLKGLALLQLPSEYSEYWRGGASCGPDRQWSGEFALPGGT